jgi:hypothetical protein
MLSGAALYDRTDRKYARHDWIPLSTPIVLTPGSLQTKEFKLDRGIPYDVELEFDQGGMDAQRMACLSGSESQKEAACKEIPSVVDMSWVILENGRPVAHGNSIDYWGGNSFERLLGSFQPEHDGRYVLTVEIHKDASLLNAAHPRLRVVIDLFERDGIAMNVGFGELEATVFFAFGFCLCLLGAGPKILRRRKDRRAAA